MEQVVMMAMQTAQEFAQRMAVTPLTEYEALMYEAICRFVETYMNVTRRMLLAAKGETSDGSEGSDFEGQPSLPITNS